MKANLPIPASWRLFLEDLYRRLHRQVTSPWTKAAVLLLLFIFVTRNELSFNITIGGGNFFSSQASVFGNDPSSHALFAGYAPSGDREWTARELDQLAYVGEYRSIALKQMKQEGIPASITLAQGLLESGIGKSTLATRNNNHFGLKCFSKACSKGHCSNHSDDHHKDFFRIFDTPEDSYEAHATLLQKSRYKKLFQLKRTDYRGWARELSRAGYATDPKYADKLIAMIERLQLHRYDR